MATKSLVVPAYKKSAKTGSEKRAGITFKTTSGTSQPSAKQAAKAMTSK